MLQKLSNKLADASFIMNSACFIYFYIYKPIDSIEEEGNKNKCQESAVLRNLLFNNWWCEWLLCNLINTPLGQEKKLFVSHHFFF